MHCQHRRIRRIAKDLYRVGHSSPQVHVYHHTVLEPVAASKDYFSAAATEVISEASLIITCSRAITSSIMYRSSI
jgi:hypothetical protein